MKLIILAGGVGSRLQSVVNTVPKPMADIEGKPFLKYLIDFYESQGVEEFILSVGYKRNAIKNYFNGNKRIVFNEEKQLLGTGGAIKVIFNNEKYNEDSYVVTNGDTFLEISLVKLRKFHYNNKNDISIALVKMKNFDRYGSVEVKDNHITSFNEKKFCKEAYINAGVYLVNRDIFDNYNLEEKFSFEEFISNNLNVLKVGGMLLEHSYFIDIGIPEDYKKAQNDFKELF